MRVSTHFGGGYSRTSINLDFHKSTRQHILLVFRSFKAVGIANRASSSYPMPTLALINGHAFAGGLMTAMMHDYRIMNPHKGYVCLNELDFGAPLLPPMASIFRQKLPRPDTFRTMILESKRFNALEALKEGIVDGLGGWEEAKVFWEEMKLVKRGESGVYGVLKAEMWKETVKYLDGGEAIAKREAEIRAQSDSRKNDEGRARVESWERSSTHGKVKL